MELGLGFEALVKRLFFEEAADAELSTGSARVEAMIASLLDGDPVIFQFSPRAARLAAEYRDSLARFHLAIDAWRRSEEGGTGRA